MIPRLGLLKFAVIAVIAVISSSDRWSGQEELRHVARWSGTRFTRGPADRNGPQRLQVIGQVEETANGGGAEHR